MAEPFEEKHVGKRVLVRKKFRFSVMEYNVLELTEDGDYVKLEYVREDGTVNHQWHENDGWEVEVKRILPDKPSLEGDG